MRDNDTLLVAHEDLGHRAERDDETHSTSWISPLREKFYARGDPRGAGSQAHAKHRL